MKLKQLTIQHIVLENGEPVVKDVTFWLAPTPLEKIAGSSAMFAPGGTKTEEGVADLRRCIFWGAKRAGSAITEEWLSTNIDSSNSAAVYDVFIEVNGFQKALKSGEAKAETEPLTS